jgi:hypothetical protein
MTKHTRDIINELLGLQNKMDTIFEECLNDSMTRPLLWVQFKDAFNNTTLAKLNTGFSPPYSIGTKRPCPTTSKKGGR